MQAILQKKSSQHAALFTGDSAAYKLYLDSLELRINGEWKNAGDKLVRCAEKYSALRMYLECACVYCEAAECYLKVDKNEAQCNWASAVKVFCDLNRFDAAGRIEKRIAEIHFRFQHWEDAALHYRKAANFMLSEPELSDYCFEQSADALIRNNDSNQSHLIYENIALSCASTNLRFFEADSKLFMAILCLIGIPVLPPVEEKTKSSRRRTNKHSNAAPGSEAEGSRPTTPSTPHDPSSSLHGAASAHQAEPSHDYASVHSKVDAQAALNHQFRVKYDEIIQKLTDYDSFTTTWRTSKYKLFLQNIIRYRLEEDYHHLMDHLYFWNNIRPLNDLAMKLLKVMADETKQLLERSELAAKLAAEAEAKAKAEGKTKKLVPPKT